MKLRLANIIKHLLLLKLVVPKNSKSLFNSLTRESFFGTSQILKNLLNRYVFLQNQKNPFAYSDDRNTQTNTTSKRKTLAKSKQKQID